VSPAAPSLRRRLASMLYEAILLFAVGFIATWAFQLFAGTLDITSGWRRHALQAFIVAVFAAYFLWCWLRGGQTLAMKTWRIRLVDITPRTAILRFLCALVLVPTGASIVWAAFARDRQFLHDRLAGSRLILVA
jgi:uncharacterized RDD family membrane protein YckC